MKRIPKTLFLALACALVCALLYRREGKPTTP